VDIVSATFSRGNLRVFSMPLKASFWLDVT
jgi:hypothetical protein